MKRRILFVGGTLFAVSIFALIMSAEVSDLLTELHAAIAEVRARPPEARDSLALMELAERVNLPVDDLTELLATLQAQPTAVRERFLRRFVEAWLVQQREASMRSSTEGRMAKVLDGRQAVPLEEVALAQACQLDALMNVLERHASLKKAEVLEEIKRLKASTRKAR